jgi:ABC-type nitrate/sulfonate/bicarbonate transport system permease component
MSTTGVQWAAAPSTATADDQARIEPPEGPARAAARRRAGTLRTALRRLLRLLLQFAVTIAVVAGGWTAFLAVFDVNRLVGKTPAEVWAYLVTEPEAGANRASMWDSLSVTLVNAGIGFVSGVLAGVILAVAFVLWRPVAQMFMPVAMILRAVPLVAMTPVIALVFGRGLVAVAVICAVIVFFPTLINVVLGLRTTPEVWTDLIRAYGGGRWHWLVRTGLPNALPALFASARISVPGAVVGALVAEWLATGTGMGARMQADITGFQYVDLWSAVVVLTLTSLIVYGVIGIAESLVLARFGPERAD